MLLWTRRIHFRQPHRKKIDRKPKIAAQIPKKMKDTEDVFFKKIFLSNCSCKHVECSCGIPASNFWTKKRKFFAQCPEMIENLDSFFWQPCWKMFAWIPKKVSSLCKEGKNFLFFFQTKRLKIILCTHRKQYSQPCQKVSVKSLKVFRSFLKKIKTPTIFPRKLIFFQDFLWTRRFQYWQSCSKYFDKKLKQFAQ